MKVLIEFDFDSLEFLVNVKEFLEYLHKSTIAYWSLHSSIP
jgi:hypothetical protein